MAGSATALFHIDASTGVVTFSHGILDRETEPFYVLLLQAVDEGNLTTSAKLTIKLEDVNDNYPVFNNYESLSPSNRKLNIGLHGDMLLPPSREYFNNSNTAVVRIPESQPSGSRVTQMIANDKDIGLFADIRYIIESQTSYDFANNSSSIPMIKSTNSFLIEPTSGSVLVRGKLMADHFYLLNISAIDGGGLSTTTIVSVAVYDVNDHAPRFHLPIYNFNILEGTYLVGEVGSITAVDEDAAENGRISYQIVLNRTQNAENFPFRIGETSGTLLATGLVDRENQARYQFTVFATDHGVPPQTSSVLVHITVTDSNDHNPKFYGYQTINSSSKLYPKKSLPVYLITIPEDTPKGKLIATIFANDSDSANTGNGIVLYKIEEQGSPFGIDSKNGSIYTLQELDYETNPSMQATIVASDVGTPTKSATALLQVSVTDVREYRTDRLFDQEQYVVS